MKGDVEFLREFAAIWFVRFRHSNQDVTNQVEPIDTKLLPPSSFPNSSTSSSKLTQTVDWLQYLHFLYDPHFKPISVHQVEFMCDDDVILSAVDFHCSPLVSVLLSPSQLDFDFIHPSFIHSE